MKEHIRKDDLIMPYYPNPYSYTYPISYPVQNVQPTVQQPPQAQLPQYMINVDGENSAKSWQPTVIPQPNTIIPLFDSDGIHVYFKTYDAYGRMNPIRKGRIVFDDEIQAESVDYVRKEDMKALEQRIESIEQMLTAPNNQNGSKN